MRSTYIEKSLPHYSWDAWQSNNKNLEKITLFKSTTANNVRQDGQQLRSDTSNTIAWKLKDTNLRLSDRISDVEQWFRNLERTLQEVKDQINGLSNAKVAVEKTLVENLPLLEAVKECLSLRDRRTEIDVVEDDAYDNIQRELKLLDAVCNKLREMSRNDWRQLVDLKENRDRLTADLNDKEKALRIDHYQHALTPCSADISFKPWPLDIPEHTVNEAQWLQHSVENRAHAEASSARGMHLTNDSWALIRTSNNDIRQQRQATQFALRRRQHETLQTRDRLAAQRKDLMDEIAKIDNEMRKLEIALCNTKGPLKLAHTRLENRKWRPRMELVHDMPQKGLREEVNHLVESRESLTQQLRDTRNVLNGLQNHLHEVEDDLRRKENSLAIETTCLKIHSRPNKAPYQTDIAWLADNSYLLSSLERGTLERKLEHLTCSGHPIQRAKATIGTMTDPAQDEYCLVD